VSIISKLLFKFPDFAARLDGEGPIGVAVSGGGDSVALLYALAEWNRKSLKTRPLEVFCVDHGLNPSSPQWTQSVADHAARVGAGFTALHWRGEKPLTGLAAAARLARHRLLAAAARGKGIAVLCLAHTADDIAEAQAMRGQGSNVGAPRAWSPSPVWPEGRGIFLYRPFVNIRREALRDYLHGIGAGWIDDPANDNPDSLRARTRKALYDKPLATKALERDSLIPASRMRDLLHMPETFGPLGLIALKDGALDALPRETALRLLAAAAVCAGGGDRLPKQEKVEGLAARLPSGKSLTLAGARLRRWEGLVTICRETGDIGRNGRRLVPVRAGETSVWDGRFEVVSSRSGHVGPSGSARAGLSKSDREALLGLPEALRGNQPVFAPDEPGGDQNVYLPSDGSGFQAACLVMPRLYAALGLIPTESAVKRAKNDCVLMRINDV